MNIRHTKLPIFKPILVFTNWGQKWMVLELEYSLGIDFELNHRVCILWQIDWKKKS